MDSFYPIGGLFVEHDEPIEGRHPSLFMFIEELQGQRIDSGIIIERIT